VFTLIWSHRSHVGAVDFQSYCCVFTTVGVVEFTFFCRIEISSRCPLEFIVWFKGPNGGLCAEAFRELRIDFPARQHGVVCDIFSVNSPEPGEDGVVIERVLENFRNVWVGHEFVKLPHDDAFGVVVKGF